MRTIPTADIYAQLTAAEQEIVTALSEVLTTGYGVAEDAGRNIRLAAEALVAYWLSALQRDYFTPTPSAITAGARAAARQGVGLDRVMRTWMHAHRTLDEYLENAAIGSDLRALTRSTAQISLLEHVLPDVARAYLDQHEQRLRPQEVQQREVIDRLLTGAADSMLDDTDIGYGLERWHLGAIAWGPGARQSLVTLAADLGRDLLSIERENLTVWGWIGGSGALERARLDYSIDRQRSPSAASLAFGTAARSIDGWRLTHIEAKAAYLVAQERSLEVAHCTDVLLDAAVLQSPALRASLFGAYLDPLSEMAKNGRTARETLRAYFACGRAIASSANLLGVTRRTMERRLQTIEDTLGRPLHRCCLELEVALRLAPNQDIPSN